MNALSRFVKSFGTVLGRPQSGPESFYGAITQTQPTGGPSFREARRDFEQVSRHTDRTGIY
jgi:hypothetical protein